MNPMEERVSLKLDLVERVALKRTVEDREALSTALRRKENEIHEMVTGVMARHGLQAGTWDHVGFERLAAGGLTFAPVRPAPPPPPEKKEAPPAAEDPSALADPQPPPVGVKYLSADALREELLAEMQQAEAECTATKST